MAKHITRKWLRFRSLVLTGLLGLMGVAFTGCPQPEYGVVPLYGVREVKEAPAPEAAPQPAGQETPQVDPAE